MSAWASEWHIRRRPWQRREAPARGSSARLLACVCCLPPWRRSYAQSTSPAKPHVDSVEHFTVFGTGYSQGCWPVLAGGLGIRKSRSGKYGESGNVARYFTPRRHVPCLFYCGGETGIRTPGRFQVIEITSGLLYLTEITTVALILHSLSSLAGPHSATADIDTKSTPRRLQGLRPSIELAVELVISEAIEIACIRVACQEMDRDRRCCSPRGHSLVRHAIS